MSTPIERAFGGRWMDELWTFVARIDYDFNNCAGHLHLPPDCCCDARGCINFFRRIDPKVRAIYTYAGIEPDLTYRRIGQEWASYAGDQKIGQGFIKPCTDGGKANATVVRAFLRGIDLCRHSYNRAPKNDTKVTKQG